MKLSIVMPVYNEKNTLLTILKQVLNAQLPDQMQREIILVDDFSTDGTGELLMEIKDKQVKIFYHDKNQGKGAALQTGFSHCQGDIVIIQDADLEYDPNEYSKLIKPILENKADVVYGSRFIGGDEHRVLYFWHYMANKLLTTLSNMFSDLNLTDMETCFKVFKINVIKKLVLEEKRFGIEPELTAKIAKMAREDGLAVYEMGIAYHGRTYNEGKKIGLKDAFRAFWCIFKYNSSPFANLIKYSFNGILVAISQFFTITSLVEYFNFNTKYLENVAYALSIEVSIVVGFFLHAFITWRYKFKNAVNFLMKLMQFQLVTGVSFLIRQGLFYLLQKSGMNYKLNTLIGIGVAVIINFFGYQNIVFKGKNVNKKVL